MTIQITLDPLPEALAVTFQPGEKLGEIFYGETNTGHKSLALSFGPVDKCTPEKLRQTGGHLANWLLEHKDIKNAALHLTPLENLGIGGGLEALLEGILLGGFRFDPYKSDTPARAPILIGIQSPAPAGVADTLARATIVCEAQNLARAWGHEPPNVINPLTLAERCGSLAAETGLKCTVIDDQQLEAMGAGAIVAVGKASQTPSRLIILEYPGHQPGQNPFVLVGKAITFDTGGYTLKTREGMVGMKYDKCGAMAVIGVLQAAARLKLASPVVGIIAAAENMIAGNAYRPNDIIKTLSGKTVEIISADAEGRMVLADALTYACRNYQPSALIDLATLTGGVGVALGEVRAGLMANDQTLAAALFQAGEQTDERLWQLPLDDEYLELIRGDDSDLKNSGSAKASAIVGGMFLKQFLEGEVPWAHLDIASVAFPDKPGPYRPKGASGFGVRLLINLLESALVENSYAR